MTLSPLCFSCTAGYNPPPLHAKFLLFFLPALFCLLIFFNDGVFVSVSREEEEEPEREQKKEQSYIIDTRIVMYTHHNIVAKYTNSSFSYEVDYRVLFEGRAFCPKSQESYRNHIPVSMWGFAFAHPPFLPCLPEIRGEVAGEVGAMSVLPSCRTFTRMSDRPRSECFVGMGRGLPCCSLRK